MLVCLHLQKLWGLRFSLQAECFLGELLCMECYLVKLSRNWNCLLFPPCWHQHRALVRVNILYFCGSSGGHELCCRHRHFPAVQITASQTASFWFRNGKSWKNSNMGLSDLYTALLGKMKTNTHPKIKASGVQCEFYQGDLRIMKQAWQNWVGRVWERKSVPDIWVLAWHSQAGLGGFLLDISDFLGHQLQIRPLEITDGSDRNKTTL